MLYVIAEIVVWREVHNSIMVFRSLEQVPRNKAKSHGDVLRNSPAAFVPARISVVGGMVLTVIVYPYLVILAASLVFHHAHVLRGGYSLVAACRLFLSYPLPQHVYVLLGGGCLYFLVSVVGRGV